MRRTQETNRTRMLKETEERPHHYAARMKEIDMAVTRGQLKDVADRIAEDKKARERYTRMDDSMRRLRERYKERWAALERLCNHMDESLWLDGTPDSSNRVRTVCRECKKFLGYRWADVDYPRGRRMPETAINGDPKMRLY